MKKLFKKLGECFAPKTDFVSILRVEFPEEYKVFGDDREMARMFILNEFDRRAVR